MNNVGKTAMKQKKEDVEIWNEVPMLFKIFKTYPVISLLLKRYETLSRIEINTLDECKYKWKMIEPVDALSSYDLDVVSTIPEVSEMKESIRDRKKNHDEKSPKKAEEELTVDEKIKRLFGKEALKYHDSNRIARYSSYGKRTEKGNFLVSYSNLIKDCLKSVV